MDYKQIEFLLEKYWQCQTTLEEEEVLRSFFVETQKLPAHLQEYREIFVYQERERKVQLGVDFDRKILAHLRKGKRRLNVLDYLIRIAAIIMLIVVIKELMVHQERSSPEVEQTPETALVEIQQALDFVSLKLNRGRELIVKNMIEIETMTQYIKE